ncbi:hypothetical protein ACWGH2_36695 [Streptomyces sp. NPDC054871]
MMHELEDIERERSRIAKPPSPRDTPPVLCFFDVMPTLRADDYAAHLRPVLDAALSLALSEGFDTDLPVESIPQWFATVSSSLSEEVPEFARRGRERYVSAFQGGPWRLQEWLYEFDPESETRGWAWWDLTRSAEGRIRIWVDTWGESFFACDELRWVALVAGADEVSGPHIVSAETYLEARQGG